jgi:hypothetical protein
MVFVSSLIFMNNNTNMQVKHPIQIKYRVYTKQKKTIPCSMAREICNWLDWHCCKRTRCNPRYAQAQLRRSGGLSISVPIDAEKTRAGVNFSDRCLQTRNVQVQAIRARIMKVRRKKRREPWKITACNSSKKITACSVSTAARPGYTWSR